MRKLFVLMLVAVMMSSAVSAVSFAHDGEVHCSGIFFVDGRVRASVSPTGATYGLVVNLTEDTVTLTGGTSDAVDAIEIHEMSVGDDDVMVMRPVEGGVVIPTGHAAELRPGGLHAMMIGLDDMLMAGDTFDLTLTFEDGTELPLSLPIVDIDATMDTNHDDHEDMDEEGDHEDMDTGSDHQEGGHDDMDMGEGSEDHAHDDMDMMDYADVKSVSGVGECEGLVGVVINPNPDMDIVYDLVFLFEDSTQWQVSVPFIGIDDSMDGMEMDSDSSM